MRALVALNCLWLALPAAGLAQSAAGTPVDAGKSYSIPSTVLGETRVVDIQLPAGYAANPNRRYPVLVVLDGEFEFPIAAAMARFYASVTHLPPLIVVGVRNTDRTRDLTTAPAPGFAKPPEVETAGGADRFLRFLSDELLPYVDRQYRTVPMRVLVGHSLGGLFALHALATRPALFTGYLIMEPAAWWNNQKEFREARAALAQPAARHARVMQVNTEPLTDDTTGWGGGSPMVRQFETTGEDHASMAAAGMMMGLRGMFADFRPIEWRPGMRPIAMLAQYDSLAARVGYDVPVERGVFDVVFRMSVDSRWFDDAERVVTRMEHSLGPSDASQAMRDRLARARAAPAPRGFVQLEFPAHRPTPREAQAFLGRWESIGTAQPHSVEVRAAGDTIVVHDREFFGNDDPFEGDRPVIQVTADGVLEWGLPVFRGLAAVEVLRGRVESDGTMTVTREVRGWVPIGPGPNLALVEKFRRVGD